MFLFKTLVLREEAPYRLQGTTLSTGVLGAQKERKAFVVPFCGCDLGKDGEELEETGLWQVWAARAYDMYVSLSQFLYDNWSWCWSWSLHPVTICCKKGSGGTPQ